MLIIIFIRLVTHRIVARIDMNIIFSTLYSVLYYSSMTIGVLLTLLFIKCCYKYSRALKKLAFYREQGIFLYPGADKFIVGNLFDSLKFSTASKENENPIVNGTGYLLD